MKSLVFFLRHPHSIYFSIEKIFHGIQSEIKKENKFTVDEKFLPYTSHWSHIRNNIAFVKKFQSDVNHITGDIHYSILGCSSTNLNVLTIHDCVLLRHYPKSNPRYWIILWLWYKLPVKKADVVTVISENTKIELIHFTNCPQEKIRVIPNFIDPLFTRRQKLFASDRPVLLFIGTAPNKNLERTIRAISGLQIELCIVGYTDEKQLELLKQQKVRYRTMNNLTDEQMRNAYATSDILLFPSTYEGFGLPIIEAQATGLAVITSQLEPMLSVAGEAACFVDPHQVESIRSGVLKMIENVNFRNALIEKGYKNVERFRLEVVAKQYSDLYIEMMNRKVV